MLIKSWKFRILIIVYVLCTVALLVYLFNYFRNEYWGWCYDGLRSAGEDNDGVVPLGGEYSSVDRQSCNEIKKSHILHMLEISLLLFPITYYLAQLFLFKVIINFIILGNQKHQNYKTNT